MHLISKTSCAILLLAALAGGMAGCLDTNRPLGDPATAQRDEALLGVWQSDSNPNEFIFIGKTDDKDTPAGVMHVIKSGFDKDDKTTSGPQSFDFTITAAGDAHIINLFTNTAMQNPSYGDWVKDDSRACHILRYELKGDALSVWEQANDDAETKAVDAGKIKSVKDGSSQRDAASVLDYLKNGGLAALFPDASKDTYKRVTK